MYEYAMVQVPPNLALQGKHWLSKAPDVGGVAAAYLHAVVNEWAQQGWEFQRVDTIGITSSPGCIAGLFGAKQTIVQHYVVTFRRPA